MKFIETGDINEYQKSAIIELWNREYPLALALNSMDDFDKYLDKLMDKQHILLIDENETIKGWLIYFMRDGEKCFAMILDSSIQSKGWGSKFLSIARERNTELNGWVVDNDQQPKQNGENYVSPIGFYKKNGFDIRQDIPLEKANIRGIKVVWKLT